MRHVGVSFTKILSYADPESFVRGGPTLTVFCGFLADEDSK